MKVVWSLQAEADLDALVRYIADANLAAALDHDERIRRAIAGLSDYPR